MKPILACFLLCLSGIAYAQKKDPKTIVSQLTLEEKVNLVVGMGMNIPGMNTSAPVIGQTTDKVAGAAGTTFGIPRLGLANTVVADGPAGLRIDTLRKDDTKKYYATAWPIATLLASTWDTKLVEKVGNAMGKEVSDYGVDVLLAPALNIHRNALGGRNFEYYSEDPLISGKMAAAIVNGIEANGVGTSVKHFAANNQETNRNTVNTIVSERALREIYLKGFQIVVKEAQPWTVMSSYNLINGKYTSEDYDLLTTILRKEWGFKGIVMTDWFGGKDAVAQMKAGNDLIMPGKPDQKKAILDAVLKGKLDTAILNKNVERIITYIINTPSDRKLPFSNNPDLTTHGKLVRSAAAEGMILLKNTNTSLPIAAGKKIAVFGNASYNFIAGGTGSGDVNEAYTVSLVEGLERANYKLDKQLKEKYLNHLVAYNNANPKKNFFAEIMNPTPPAPEMVDYENLLLQKARENDLAMITIGRNAGEFRDRKKENDFYLSAQEQQLLRKVADAFHQQGKKLIVVINAGGIIEMASWRDQVDAILMAWQGGQEGGNAVADIISGKVNPSGKLATTIPVRYEDDYSSKNFPGKEFPEKAVMGGMGMREVPAEVVYEEGIFVGYRYFETFGVKPAYAFGFGESYTRFQYGKTTITENSNTNTYTIAVPITNIGKSSGKEIVQLYVTAPGKSMVKPAIELKAFEKTNLLAPGKKQILQLTLHVKDLASYDTKRSAWVVEPGMYAIKIGAASDRILQTQTIQIDREIIVEQCNKVLTPQIIINELTK